MLEYTLTVADLAAFADRQSADSPEGEARRRRTRLVGAWLAGGAVYLVVFAVSTLPLLLGRQLLLAGGTEFLDVVVGVLAGWWEWRGGVVAGWLQRRRSRLRARVALEQTGATRRLWLDEDGLNVAAGDRSTHVAWATITQLAETDEHVFVYTGPGAAHVIPRRAGFEVDALVAGIRAHVHDPS
nr:YcxB family protein [Propionicimonas sp.]